MKGVFSFVCGDGMLAGRARRVYNEVRIFLRQGVAIHGCGDIPHVNRVRFDLWAVLFRRGEAFRAAPYRDMHVQAVLVVRTGSCRGFRQQMKTLPIKL